MALVEGSSPGISLTGGGFVCNEEGNWPLGGATDAGEVIGDWTCNVPTTSPPDTIILEPTTTLGPPTIVPSPAVIVMEPSGDRYPVYRYEDGFAVVIPDILDCTFVAVSEVAVPLRYGPCENLQSFATILGNRPTEPGQALYAQGNGIIAEFPLDQVSVGNIPVAGGIPNIGSLLDIPDDLPLLPATGAGGGLVIIEGIPGIWTLAPGVEE